MPPDLDKTLAPEEVERTTKGFEAVKKDFTKMMCDKCGEQGLMGSWSKLNTYDMALKADKQLAGLYGAIFLLATLHVHTTATGLQSGLEETENGFVWNSEILSGREGIIASAYLLICKMVDLLNDHFHLGLDAEVKAMAEGQNELWKPPDR